jgi:hypothetical protein
VRRLIGAWSSEINDAADTSSQLSATLDNLLSHLSLGFPLLTIGILYQEANQTVLIELGSERDLGLLLGFVFAIHLHTRILKVGPVNDQRLLLLSVLLLFDLLFRC